MSWLVAILLFAASGEAELLELIRKNPRAVEPHFRLGVLYIQKGEQEKAREFLLKALKLQPGSVPILNNLGVNALHRGQDTEAAGYFRKALAAAPEDGTALYNLGLIELRQRRYGQAVNYLRQAARQQPKDLSVLQGLLVAQLEMASTEANGTLARILELAPGDPQYHLQLAAPLVGKGHPRAAQTVLESAIKNWPERGELHSLLGDAYEKQGRYKEAVDAYQTAVHRDPQNEAHWFSLGHEFLLHQNFDLAERIFADGLKRLPGSVRLRLGMAGAFFSRAQYAQAVATLREAIALDPRSEGAYFFLGRAFMLLGDHPVFLEGDWFKQVLEAYLQLKPNDPFPYYLNALLPGSESVRLLEHSVRLDPGFAEAWYELGKRHSDAQRFQEAIHCFRKAIDLRRDYAEAYYRLSQVYARSGDHAQAHQARELSAKYRKQQEAEAARRRKEILQFVYTLK